MLQRTWFHRKRRGVSIIYPEATQEDKNFLYGKTTLVIYNRLEEII